MDESRVVVWFSCGAASAVAAKLAIEKYAERAIVVHCDTLASEHPDNRRFYDDVQRWLRREIITIRSRKYATVDDVIEARSYLSGNKGAPCTVELKKVPRFGFELPDDVHIFGYTADEAGRIEDFANTNFELQLEWILRDQGYSKKRCLRAIEDAGIELPEMYRVGFDHNNCLACVKATSPDYWRRTRRLFPEVFARRAEQSRKYGARLVRINGERKFLDELPPDSELALWAAIEPVAEDLSCGPQCATN
jgi:hypothetical protein